MREIKVSSIDYYTWKVGAILLLFLLLFILFIANKDISDKKDTEFCYLYANEKTADNTWTQHDYPLIKEMNKEAQRYYNVSYDFLTTEPRKMIWVQGDGRASSWSFDPETKKTIDVNCVFQGIIQDGDIRTKFEVTKTVNYQELLDWRKQYE